MFIAFMFLDGTYGTGKTRILIERVKYLLQDSKNIVHFFVNIRKFYEHGKSILVPILEDDFKGTENLHIHETQFEFGSGDLEEFKKSYGIESHHHIIIDELIFAKVGLDCFLKSLKDLAESVTSCWIAMGAKPKNVNLKESLESSFSCPDLIYTLRNPKAITDYIQEQTMKTYFHRGLLPNPIADLARLNLIEGVIKEMKTESTPFLALTK